MFCQIRLSLVSTDFEKSNFVFEFLTDHLLCTLHFTALCSSIIIILHIKIPEGLAPGMDGQEILQ